MKSPTSEVATACIFSCNADSRIVGVIGTRSVRDRRHNAAGELRLIRHPLKLFCGQPIAVRIVWERANSGSVPSSDTPIIARSGNTACDLRHSKSRGARHLRPALLARADEVIE
jgi:hypothetical protein